MASLRKKKAGFQCMAAVCLANNKKVASAQECYQCLAQPQATGVCQSGVLTCKAWFATPGHRERLFPARLGCLYQACLN